MVQNSTLEENFATATKTINNRNGLILYQEQQTTNIVFSGNGTANLNQRYLSWSLGNELPNINVSDGKG